MKVLILSLVGIASSFHIGNVNRQKTVLKMSIEDTPSKIIQSFNGLNINNQWSVKDLLDNIKSKNIDGVSIFSSQDGLAAIDSDHGEVVMSNNIHFVKTFPSLIENLITNFNTNHINYDVLSLEKGNWLSNIVNNPLQFFCLLSFINVI